MISNFDIGDAFSNRLDDTSSFVTQHYRERSFGVVSRELAASQWDQFSEFAFSKSSSTHSEDVLELRKLSGIVLQTRQECERLTV